MLQLKFVTLAPSTQMKIFSDFFLWIWFTQTKISQLEALFVLELFKNRVEVCVFLTVNSVLKKCSHSYFGFAFINDQYILLSVTSKALQQTSLYTSINISSLSAFYFYYCRIIVEGYTKEVMTKNSTSGITAARSVDRKTNRASKGKIRCY